MKDININQQMGWRLKSDENVYRWRRKLFSNGDIYEGEMVKDKFEGEGVLISHAFTFRGTFLNGLFHGKGSIAWKPHTIDGKENSGSYYDGDFIKGKRHGIGKYVDGLGSTFEGIWEDDKFIRGEKISENGEHLTGSLWRNNKLDCKDSTILRANGDRYIGPTDLGEFHGRLGRCEYAKSLGTYSGQYKYGEKSGYGIRHYLDSSVFRGQFCHGEIHGDGIMEYSNGNSYSGTWAEGKYHGDGKLTYSYHNRHFKSYQGRYAQGFMCGKGKLLYSDNGYYDGEFQIKKCSQKCQIDIANMPQNGTPDGWGVRVWSTGNRFEGTWKSGEMVEGTYVSIDHCSKYSGSFKKNKKDGFGKEIWKSKDGRKFRDPVLGWLHEGDGVPSYKGEYKQGYFHGNGCFTSPDGRSYEGEFQKGLFSGKGRCILLADHQRGNPSRLHIGKHGSLYRAYKYIGEWKEGIRNGRGTLFYLDGSQKEGIFRNGVLEKIGE